MKQLIKKTSLKDILNFSLNRKNQKDATVRAVIIAKSKTYIFTRVDTLKEYLKEGVIDLAIIQYTDFMEEIFLCEFGEWVQIDLFFNKWSFLGGEIEDRTEEGYTPYNYLGKGVKGFPEQDKSGKYGLYTLKCPALLKKGKNPDKIFYQQTGGYSCNGQEDVFESIEVLPHLDSWVFNRLVWERFAVDEESALQEITLTLQTLFPNEEISIAEDWEEAWIPFKVSEEDYVLTWENCD